MQRHIAFLERVHGTVHKRLTIMARRLAAAGFLCHTEEKYAGGSMDVSNLWTAWPICGPWRLFPLPGGTNNVVWRAETADGQSYVLRLSPDLSRAPRMRSEAWLLQALEEKGLPFCLPVPLRTTGGERVVHVAPEQEAGFLATLTPLLPGSLHDRPPQRHDLQVAAQAARTLALLDQALATLPDIPHSESSPLYPSFGEFAHWHPLIPDPLAAVERLPGDCEQLTGVRTFLSEVQASVPGLYAALPQQVIHRDYDPGNILLDQQQVTAVLDFEFAGRDIRVLDLGVALSWWPAHLLGTGEEWELITAFGCAYIRQYALHKEELLALPAVFRLREAASLVHRAGRYLAGLETQGHMRRRIEHTLWREAWISVHQEMLQEHALAWLEQ
jgi:homoserine kinase type II